MQEDDCEEPPAEFIYDWVPKIPQRFWEIQQERAKQVEKLPTIQEETEAESVPDSDSETEPEAMADDQYETATVNDFAIKSTGVYQSCIRIPPMTAHTFEIKPVMISMLQVHGMYHGNYNEDVNKHITRFLEVCDSFKINGVPDDVLRLKLFPFTISDKAREWFDTLEPGSIDSWEALEAKLRARFFSDDKSVEARNAFLNFEQYPE